MQGPYKRILLLLFLLNGLQLFSQSNNAKRLAASLTNNCTSDSEKVERIANWIVHHIKYDCKYYIEQRDKYYSTKKLWRRRKAVCEGYSRIFNEMCRSVGVNSQTIYGYDKGWLYDLKDIFYTDEHAWTAYRLQDQWHLSDLTWSAGHLEVKYGMLKLLLYKFHLKRFPFKIKFKRAFNPDYYHPAPEKLLYNHLPVLANWQLMDSSISLAMYETFGCGQNDSSFFAFTKRHKGNSYCEQCDVLQKLDPEVRLKYEGREQLHVNKRNILFFLNSNYDPNEPIKHDESGDSIRIKQELFSVDSLYAYADSNLVNISMDYKFYSSKNKDKIKFFQKYFNRVNSSAKKNSRALKGMRSKLKSTGKYFKRSDSKLQRRLNSVKRIGLIGITPKPVISKRRKRLRDKSEKDLYKQMDHLMNSFLASTDNYFDTDTLYGGDSVNFVKLKSKLYLKQMSDQGFLLGHRKGFQDQYDKDVKDISDSVYALSFKIDSMVGMNRRNIMKEDREMKGYIKNNQRCIQALFKAKIDCRRAGANDGSLKTWRENIADIDSCIYYIDQYFKFVEKEYKRRNEFEKSSLKELRFANKQLVKLVSGENFFEGCRAMFITYFYKARFYKQKRRAGEIKNHISRKRNILSADLSKLRKAKIKK